MNKAKHIKPECKGFTLIELLIAMVVAGIVTAAVYAAFQSQQRSSIIQENVNVMQQNLRASMEIMIKDIRMAGYDPQSIGGLGILNVQPRATDNTPDASISGNGAIQFTADFDGDGLLPLPLNETVSYSIYDFPVASPDGKPDLARNAGGGRQLLAKNIEALGFAYAFDADQDGNLDTYDAVNINPAPATAAERIRIIWAVDSDPTSANFLDLNLDTNLDGVIDGNDDTDGNGIINPADGGTVIANVAPADIQAVRIWMLARTHRGDDRFLNRETYVVGHKVIIPTIDADTSNDNCRMRLLETTVRCRNLEF